VQEDKLAYMKKMPESPAQEKQFEQMLKAWSDTDVHVLKNVPVEGFKLSHSVKRYSTQNKWIQIVDPRGFEMQISVENLMEILESNGITKGVFAGEYLWAPKGNKMWLLPADHALAQTKGAPPKLSDLNPGDVIIGAFNRHMTYMGLKQLKYQVTLLPWEFTGTLKPRHLFFYTENKNAYVIAKGSHTIKALLSTGGPLPAIDWENTHVDVHTLTEYPLGRWQNLQEESGLSEEQFSIIKNQRLASLGVNSEEYNLRPHNFPQEVRRKMQVRYHIKGIKE